MTGASATYADLFRPAAAKNARLYDLLLIVGGSILTALCAQIAFELPLSPVPVTGQTFAVVLVGALLGSKRGALAMLAYAMEGAAGLPVFAQGRFGMPVLLGPTGGYIFGFIIAAFVVGLLAERGWDRKLVPSALAMTIGTAFIFLFGCTWLARFVGAEQVLAFGFMPFVPGAVFKIVLAAALLPVGWKLLGSTKK